MEWSRGGALVLAVAVLSRVASGCDRVMVDCGLALTHQQTTLMTATRFFGLSKAMCFHELLASPGFIGGVYCPDTSLCGLNISADIVPSSETLYAPCGVFGNSARRCEQVREIMEKGDENECATRMVGCGKCINYIGGFHCTCVEGFLADELNRTCNDVDECDDHPCNENATCTNIVGSFTCECDAGFAGDGMECGDADECRHDSCRPGALCSNTFGSYTCTCPDGYQGSKCDDMDECLIHPDICGQNTVCTNTHGSYDCGCKDGYRISDESCGDVSECVKSGAARCVNIDECALYHPCPEFSDCTDTDGSYLCTCIPGYMGDEEYGCKDIIECYLPMEQYPCPASATCTNYPGTYECSCLPGFLGSDCVDIDECQEAGICDTMATCENGAGYFTCTCNDGYEPTRETLDREMSRDNSDLRCTDLDECIYSMCPSTSDCTNFDGGYRCECHAGFAGAACYDVDECNGDTSEGGCGAHSVCVNTPGSFYCQCDQGYIAQTVLEEGGSHLKAAEPGEDCVEMDECEVVSPSVCRNLDPDSNMAQCTDLSPGYSCLCPQGFATLQNATATDDFYRTDIWCQDINECDDPLQACGSDPNVECRNEEGSFDCKCARGFRKVLGSDPIECEPRGGGRNSEDDRRV